MASTHVPPQPEELPRRPCDSGRLAGRCEGESSRPKFWPDWMGLLTGVVCLEALLVTSGRELRRGPRELGSRARSVKAVRVRQGGRGLHVALVSRAMRAKASSSARLRSRNDLGNYDESMIFVTRVCSQSIRACGMDQQAAVDPHKRGRLARTTGADAQNYRSCKLLCRATSPERCFNAAAWLLCAGFEYGVRLESQGWFFLICGHRGGHAVG